MTLEQQNTELQQRIMELMRENRFLKNEFIAVKSSLRTIKESTDATHQIIVDLEKQSAELLRQNAELKSKYNEARAEQDADYIYRFLNEFTNEFGVSQVQRKLRLGYNRAVEAIEMAAKKVIIIRTEKEWLFTKPEEK